MIGGAGPPVYDVIRARCCCRTSPTKRSEDGGTIFDRFHVYKKKENSVSVRTIVACQSHICAENLRHRFVLSIKGVVFVIVLLFQ